MLHRFLGMADSATNNENDYMLIKTGFDVMEIVSIYI